jgi:hypothetical protein
VKKEDWKKGLKKCSGCGKPVNIICACEVNNFKDKGDY